MTMKTKNRSLVQKVFTETCRGAPLELRYYRLWEEAPEGPINTCQQDPVGLVGDIHPTVVVEPMRNQNFSYHKCNNKIDSSKHISTLSH